MQEKRRFDDIPVSEEWCFRNVRSTEQWTHGYHRYPAKFLPNVVKKLIEEYALEDEYIADIFAGCGTTLIEAKIHGYPSIGVDVNPVAKLITKVKLKPLKTEKLELEYKKLIKTFNRFNSTATNNKSYHPKIDYWFEAEQRNKIAFLYKNILFIENNDIKDFFLVSLSHILKNCSRWLQSSTKPQIDPNKKITNPFEEFQKHSLKMMKLNSIYYEELKSKKRLSIPCKIHQKDARKTAIKDESIGTIITSPPYVTSYEYADIHQLTSYWFEYMNNLLEFRKRFIGTFYSKNKKTKTKTKIGQDIVDKLLEKDTRKACEVANYFNDMYDVSIEMYRILKKGGYACIVIGNTEFRTIKIKSAEVFFEMLLSVGFKEKTIIKRSIPNKLIPAIRDKNTGKFTTADNENSKLVYPEEYILIMRK